MARSSIGASPDAVQVACDSCGAALRKDVSYCDNCGARTRVARRRVRLAIRVELLLFGAIALMVVAFAVSQVHR